jgi:hypothetical protein
MAGFIDVTGWSDQAIKRLGQMDDDDFSIRTKSRKYQKPKPVNKTYLADDVWAASAQAYSINNGYVKAIVTGVPNQRTNRDIVNSILSDPIQIKQEFRDKGLEMRKYYQGLTFKVLQNKYMTPYDQSAMAIASKDSISENYDIAVITSLPSSYEKKVKRDSVDRIINFADGGFLGNIGDKVTVKIKVLKSVYSASWATYYITGITDDKKVLFFSYKSDIEFDSCVTITGNVKAFRENKTQLNRVKIISKE